MAEVGAPTKYDPEYVPMVEKMARLGLTDAQMADVLGVAMSTFSLWKTKYPDFSEANARGKPEVDDQVERSLLKRALGGFTVKETTRDKNGDVLKTVEREVPADTTAILRWLFNRRADKWREKRDESPVGDTTPLAVTFPEMTDIKALLDQEKQDNIEIQEGVEEGEAQE